MVDCDISGKLKEKLERAENKELIDVVLTATGKGPPIYATQYLCEELGVSGMYDPSTRNLRTKLTSQQIIHASKRWYFDYICCVEETLH